jgi:hypothetical protein
VALADAGEHARLSALIKAKYPVQVPISRAMNALASTIRRRSQPYGDVGVTYPIP